MTTYIKLFACSGGIANAPIHETDPIPFDEMPTESELSELAEEHMYKSIQPNAWWIVTDEDGNEVDL